MRQRFPVETFRSDDGDKLARPALAAAHQVRFIVIEFRFAISLITLVREKSRGKLCLGFDGEPQAEPKQLARSQHWQTFLIS